MELAGQGTLRFLLFLISSIAAVKSFNLTLLHTNDVHSHFVEFNAFGGRCADKLKEDKKCFGGFARQVTKVQDIRSSKNNVLFLNGGDFYQGTVWYTLHRWQIVAELVNKLTIDVMPPGGAASDFLVYRMVTLLYPDTTFMKIATAVEKLRVARDFIEHPVYTVKPVKLTTFSLGNHEFDDGLKGLLPFLENLKTKVVVCNINSSKVPEFTQYVHPSTIVEVGGERIGIIGYLTPETKFLSSAGDLEFEDEVECIKREAKRLVSEEGLNKIMAVGHSGFAVDQDIAREVPEVDIVVGGHTNTFLYTGDPPSVEEPQGPYPFLVTREDGSQALVVQDFAFGKYMGFLEVQFDDEGKVTKWSGNPILLDASVEEDPGTLELLEPYAQEVKRRVRQTVSKTNVLLRGDRLTCRMRECNLGNFLADASLDFFIEQPTEKGWNFVAIALWNSGGIRASIDERINGGNITLEDVLAVAPFGNTMDVVALKGKHLREVLEHSVKDYDQYAVDPPGSLLQVSGLRVTYNMSKPVGSRLVEIYARCADCRVPQFLPLEDEKVYEVVMNTYMAKGGDGFDVIEKNAISNRNTDELDVDIITKYAAKNSPVIVGLEGRITILSSRDDEDASKEETEDNEPTDSTTQAEPQTSGAPNLADDITSGFNKMGSELKEAGDELMKVPDKLSKIFPTFKPFG